MPNEFNTLNLLSCPAYSLVATIVSYLCFYAIWS